MKSLHIDHVAEKRVGSKGARGISGGEKRRVSIACELVATPSILFLDEPTSGLDAFSAFAVVETLKNLALSSKMMVIMTIHQPRSNLFLLFDKLLLLTKGEMVRVLPFFSLGFFFFFFFLSPAFVPQHILSSGSSTLGPSKTVWDTWTALASPAPQHTTQLISSVLFILSFPFLSFFSEQPFSFLFFFLLQSTLPLHLQLHTR